MTNNFNMMNMRFNVIILIGVLVIVCIMLYLAKIPHKNKYNKNEVISTKYTKDSNDLRMIKHIFPGIANIKRCVWSEGIRTINDPIRPQYEIIEGYIWIDKKSASNLMQQYNWIIVTNRTNHYWQPEYKAKLLPPGISNWYKYQDGSYKIINPGYRVDIYMEKQNYILYFDGIIGREH